MGRRVRQRVRQRPVRHPSPAGPRRRGLLQRADDASNALPKTVLGTPELPGRIRKAPFCHLNGITGPAAPGAAPLKCLLLRRPGRWGEALGRAAQLDGLAPQTPNGARLRCTPLCPPAGLPPAEPCKRLPPKENSTSSKSGQSLGPQRRELATFVPNRLGGPELTRQSFSTQVPRVPQRLGQWARRARPRSPRCAC